MLNSSAKWHSWPSEIIPVYRVYRQPPQDSVLQLTATTYGQHGVGRGTKCDPPLKNQSNVTKAEFHSHITGFQIKFTHLIN